MAFQMFAYLAAGWFLGSLIDDKIGMNKPIFSILLLMIFMLIYFYKLYKDLESNKS